VHSVTLTIHGDVIVVEDTRADAGFAAHPLIVGAPFIRFYVSMRRRA